MTWDEIREAVRAICAPLPRSRRLRDRIVEELARLEAELDTLTRRSEYLQHESNVMRRAMQEAGTWDAFCRDYTAYKRRFVAAPDNEGEA